MLDTGKKEETVEITTAVTDGSQVNTLVVNTSSKSFHMSDTLWGAFYEDINHSGDQGLYAELVYNRSFEEGHSGWKVDSSLGGSGDLSVK